MSRILIYVQHLLGIGHLRRAGLIAEAAAAAGLQVDLVTGGLPIADFAPHGVRIHQLPALKAGPQGFGDLRDATDNTVDQAWLDRRRNRLIALFDTCRPHVLVIETYPFGRRQMAFELDVLTAHAAAATPRPVIVSSIRDILQISRKPGRDREIVSRFLSTFDRVLVHGDPAFVPLDRSFPLFEKIADCVSYTGLVAATADAPGGQEDGTVVVSAGGGAVGEALFQAALGARALSTLAAAQWRLITGPNLRPNIAERLRADAPSGMIVETYRPDFRALLASARLSISQGGYNTVTDILGAGVAAVVVPFSSGGETEQAMRADALAGRGLAVTLSETDLTAETLAHAIDEGTSLTLPAEIDINRNGAAETARLLAQWADQKPH